MARKKRTDWRAITLDMAIETSVSQVLNRSRTKPGFFRRVPVTRVIFRTAAGTEFSGPRIRGSLREQLEKGAEAGPLRKRRA